MAGEDTGDKSLDLVGDSTVGSAAQDILGLVDFDLGDEETEDQEEDPQDPEGDDDEGEGDELDESDEDEEDDADDPDADDGDGDEDDDSETDDSDSDQIYKIKVDGEEVEVTLDEALSGYQRQRDYTRKTQELATERQKTQELAQALTEQQAQYADRLAFVEKFLALPEPDWAQVKKDHPDQYSDLRDQYDARKRQLEAVQAELQQTREEARQRWEKDREERLKAERELFQAATPEWLDETVKAEETQAMLDVALARGFTREQLEATDSHAILLILRDAARWHRHEKALEEAKNKAKKGRKSSKALPPSTPDRNTSRSKKRTTRRSKKAAAALRQDGSMRNAQAALIDLID